MNAIQIKNITKRYKDVTALDDISFSFEFGRIYGFLGRNGAGKSTLINIIANRIFADQGEVLIDGIPAKENMGVHEKIFCMSEADLYDRDLKVKDHFKWTNRFYNDFDLDKAFELSKKFNLDINKRFKALSKGYQSIFKLIIALWLTALYLMFCSLFYLAILVINRVGKTISLLIGVGISGIILLVMALFQFVFSDEIVSKAMELTMRAVGFMSDGTINQFFPILSFLIIGALFGIGSYAVIRRTELK